MLNRPRDQPISSGARTDRKGDHIDRFVRMRRANKLNRYRLEGPHDGRRFSWMTWSYECVSTRCGRAV